MVSSMLTFDNVKAAPATKHDALGARTRMGFFLTWMILKGLASDRHAAAHARLSSRKISPLASWPPRKTKLTSDDFVYKGNQLALNIYRPSRYQARQSGDDGHYVDIFDSVFPVKDKEEIEAADTWETYDKIREKLDALFTTSTRRYLQGFQSAALGKVDQSVAQLLPSFLPETTPEHEQGVITDLSKVGVEVTSLMELRTSPIPYPEAIPILIDWIENLEDRTNPDHQRQLRMELQADLQKTEAHGVAFHPLIRLARRDDLDIIDRASFGLTASLIATKEQFDDIVALFEWPNPDLYLVSFLSRQIQRSTTPEAKEILLKSLTSTNLSGYAAPIVSKKAWVEAIPTIRGLLRNPDNPVFVTEELEKALYELEFIQFQQQNSNVLDDLVGRALATTDSKELAYSARILAQANRPEIIPALERGRRSGTPLERRDIAKALKTLQTAQAN
ncbi:hypothetical protein ACIQTZ_11755 [Paenarthrobacter sp. NPDC090520]|uniref:hypothetical protein n=1 Tax=Paenarthrobacter sp. NPDC090520 TaxID=3364382 RepID=UPI00382B2851